MRLFPVYEICEKIQHSASGVLSVRLYCDILAAAALWGVFIMIKFYKTIDGVVTEISRSEEGCWISVIAPTQDEIASLIQNLSLDSGFIQAALDEEETSRVENEEGQTLLIVDFPCSETDNQSAILYSTMPMGIILTEHNVVTVSLKENVILSEMASGVIRDVQTHMKTRFVLKLLLRIATKFLQYLKQIDKISYFMERQLHKSMRNKELIQLLDLEKSLVYFSTSLNANQVTLEKIHRGRVIRMYEEDQELMEDVLIEFKQAIEMAEIYSGILSGTMDAFASVISNNLNILMKRLTILTILMAIPTIVFSYYGMNVEGLPLTNAWFPLALSLVATVAVYFVMRRMEK